MMMHGNEKLIVGGMICGWNDVRVVGDNLLLQDFFGYHSIAYYPWYTAR